MNTLTTYGIRITVETFYQKDTSVPDDDFFLHAYRIRILNTNAFDVQLLRRHWIIKESSRETREVEGEGVIGEQPILKPDQNFVYVSGCDLNSSLGSMRGKYLFENKETGELFDVEIPVFLLEADIILN